MEDDNITVYCVFILISSLNKHGLKSWKNRSNYIIFADY